MSARLHERVHTNTLARTFAIRQALVAASVTAAAKFSSTLGGDKDTDKSKQGEPGQFDL
jgi:hypothetical protein